MSRPLALITGGWRRIGASVARRLAGAGWDLVLHAHHSAARDAKLEAELAGAGAAAHFLEGELGDPGIAASLVAEAGSLAGRPLELLVNSASLFGDDTIDTISAEIFDRHMAVNLRAPLLLTRAFAEALGSGEGSVVHILDQRVLNPVPDQLSYTLSKQALHASVRTLARALAPRVRVNGVAPGAIAWPEDGQFDPAERERIVATTPLARVGGSDDIAQAVHFLAIATYVTGQIIAVDGGRSIFI